MKEQIAKEEEALSSSKNRVDEFNERMAAIDERRKIAQVCSTHGDLQ